MTTLQARRLTLKEARQLFGYQELYDGDFNSLLELSPITQADSQELMKIRNDFRPYLEEGEVLEGQIRLVVIGPLLRLAGYYDYPIQMKVESNIAPIDFETEDIRITGRFDIIAVNKEQKTPSHTDLWVLILETKASLAEPLAGLPQLLAYAYQSLKRQESAWGLLTNGINYKFIYLHSGNTLTYQHTYEFSLLNLESSQKLLQVLRAIVQV